MKKNDEYAKTKDKFDSFFERMHDLNQEADKLYKNSSKSDVFKVIKKHLNIAYIYSITSAYGATEKLVEEQVIKNLNK